MKLRSLQLHRFSVFKTASFEFVPGINVFIGRNGSGKSHLLKLLYSLLAAQRESGEGAEDGVYESNLKRKLAGVFRPDGGAIGRLVSRTIGRSSAEVDLCADSGRLRVKWTTLGNLHVVERRLKRLESAVFLPSREALAMYEGFVQAYENRELSFDETYRDLCVHLSGAALRGPRMERAKTLAAPLENAVGGAIRLIGGRFYRLAAGDNLEAHLLSEGLRKLGALTHLVLNGSLTNNGFLFWDEPEANLNPRMVVLIASMLRRLAQSGVQVFVATHDYLLLGYLALADDQVSPARTGRSDTDIRFFSLDLSANSSSVVVHAADRLRELEPNDILNEFASYYDLRAERVMVKAHG